MGHVVCSAAVQAPESRVPCADVAVPHTGQSGSGTKAWKAKAFVFKSNPITVVRLGKADSHPIGVFAGGFLD